MSTAVHTAALFALHVALVCVSHSSLYRQVTFVVHTTVSSQITVF